MQGPTSHGHSSNALRKWRRALNVVNPELETWPREWLSDSKFGNLPSFDIQSNLGNAGDLPSSISNIYAYQ
jgi:hypothetical protein